MGSSPSPAPTAPDSNTSLVAREIRSASRNCARLLHQHAQVIQAIQLHQVRDRLDAIASFDRDCEDIFNRIRRSHIDLTKKSKQMVQAVDKERRIQWQRVEGLNSSVIDLKKAKVLYELQKRRAEEGEEEEQLAIQRLIDTLFEQRAQSRRLRRQLRRRHIRSRSEQLRIGVVDGKPAWRKPSLRKMLLHENTVLHSEYHRRAVALHGAEYQSEVLMKKLQKNEQRWLDLNTEREGCEAERRARANCLWSAMMSGARLFDALQQALDYEKRCESLYQALSGILQCRSCHETLTDPVFSSQCQQIQCRLCLLRGRQQTCPSCNDLHSAKRVVRLQADLGPAIQAVHDLRSLLGVVSRYAHDMALRVAHPRLSLVES